MPKKLHKIFPVGLIFFRLVGVQHRRKTTCSRSDLHKVSDLWSCTKSIPKNLPTEQKISCRHGAAHVKLLLSDCVRNTIQKGARNADLWNALETLFAGAGEAKGGTLMHLLLTNKKEWW